MTEDELKTLPPEPETIEIQVEQKPQKAAADEAAEKLQQQLEAAKSAEKAARETADAERQGRLAAEQTARQREQEATQYRGQAQSAELNTITTAIDGATRVRDMAKIELKRALEGGEFDKVADAQEKLAEAAANIVNLNQAKNYAETVQPQPVEGRIQQVQQDPVERFISSATPASQQWLRQHRDMIVQDHNGTRVDDRVLAAHYQAKAQGIRPDSEEYFSYVDSALRPAQTNGDRGEVATTPPKQARNAPVAAPVSRESSVSNNGRPLRITLTKDQVEAAHIYGDPKKTEREREIEYWNNLQALKDEGRIGNYNVH